MNSIIITAATVILTIVTAVYVWITWKILSTQSDPCVIVTVSDDKDRSSVLQLVAKNIGNGIAYDVRFKFTHPIPAKAFGYAPEDVKDVSDMSYGPFVTGIPALGPGECRIVDWGQYGGIKAKIGDRKIFVTCRFKKYNKEMKPIICPIEVDSFLGTTANDSASAKAVKSLEKIQQGIDKLTSVTGGIRIQK